MSTLKSLTHAWRDIGDRRLDIPEKVLDGFESEYSSDAERFKAAIRYWLLRDPLASWRKLIFELDCEDIDDGGDFREVADNIRSYAEKQPGQPWVDIIVLTLFKKQFVKPESFVLVPKDCIYLIFEALQVCHAIQSSQ